MEKSHLRKPKSLLLRFKFSLLGLVITGPLELVLLGPLTISLGLLKVGPQVRVSPLVLPWGRVPSLIPFPFPAVSRDSLEKLPGSIPLVVACVASLVRVFFSLIFWKWPLSSDLLILGLDPQPRDYPCLVVLWLKLLVCNSLFYGLVSHISYIRTHLTHSAAFYGGFWWWLIF